MKMVKAILVDGNDEYRINLAGNISDELTPEIRKKEFLQAFCNIPAYPLLYAFSIFYEERENRVGARNLAKSGLLRALGIFLNSHNLFKKSIVYYEKCLNKMNLYY